MEAFFTRQTREADRSALRDRASPRLNKTVRTNQSDVSSSSLDHGNYIPSMDLTKAITQASRYLFEVEREANSVKFQERTGGVKTVKPRCILIFGRSNEWDQQQIESYRILNAGFHNLGVMTYDHVLTRAKQIVGI